MTVPVSAINPLRTAIHAVLGALVPPVKMYLGVAPRSKPLPYVVLGAETEVDDPRVMQPGNDQTVQLGCWAEDAWEAQELYNRVRGALHDAELEIEGHVTVLSQVSRITGFLEQGVAPDALGPYCVVGRLTTRTLVAP